jgi:hypothetical protein
MGECPEWQRELTVNQPSYDFEGSSPSSPTSLRLLRKLRLGKPQFGKPQRMGRFMGASARLAILFRAPRKLTGVDLSSLA